MHSAPFAISHRQLKIPPDVKRVSTLPCKYQYSEMTTA